MSCKQCTCWQSAACASLRGTSLPHGCDTHAADRRLARTSSEDAGQGDCKVPVLCFCC